MDFDNWENIYGAKGWSYEEVLPYFLKSENNTDTELVANSPEYHSTGGPLGVSSHKNPDPVYKTYLEAANKLGYPTVDTNGQNQSGIAIVQSTIGWDGIRSSTTNAFLVPNRKRQNLHIITSAFVTKILFDKQIDGIVTASGVIFDRNGQSFTVKANKEVILSAGAIRSPQLLMLSGVGPEAHLKQLNIPVIRDLPVGNNFHDHVFVNLVLKIKNQCQVLSKEPNVENLNKFFVNKNGSTLSLRHTIYTVFSTANNPNKDWPNGHIQSATTINPQLCQYVFNIQPILIRPKSRGTIRLSSTNPSDMPLVDPNYYSEEEDMQTMLEIVKEAIRIFESPEFLEFSELSKPIAESCEPCTNNTYDCESYLKCFIGTGGTYGHPVGSCRMGSATDNNAVVDERLRVRNVSGLRVIDASIMPEITSSGVNAPSIMIGERGAQFIIEDNPVQTNACLRNTLAVVLHICFIRIFFA